MEKRSIFYEYFEPLLLVLAAIFCALPFEAMILRALFLVVLSIAIIEAIMIRVEVGSIDYLASSSFLFVVTVLIVTLIMLIEHAPSSSEWLFVIGIVVSADIASIGFGRALEGYSKPVGTSLKGMNYLGYAIAAPLSMFFGCVVGFGTDIGASYAVLVFLATGWLVAAYAKQLTAFFKKRFFVERSNEMLIQLPVVGYSEVFVRSSGWLDCVDSVTFAMAYFLILQQIERLLT